MISRALMKEQFKRTSIIMVLALIGLTLFVLMPTIFPTDNTPERAQGMLDLLAMRNPVMLAATIILPFAAAMLNFSYLFDSKKSAAYYELSDNKSQLFWTSSITGLIYIILPLLFFSLLLLIRVRFPVPLPLGEYALCFPADLFSREVVSNGIINTFGTVFSFFLRAVVTSFFAYALWLFAFSVSSRWVISALVFVLVLILPILVFQLGVAIASTYVFGFYPANVVGAEVIAAYSSPFVWSLNWGEANQGVFFLIYIGISIVLMGLAATFFASRKIEKSEKPIVFSGVKNLIVFILSIWGMVAMGGFMMTLVTGRWFLYYGFVLGFALAFIVSQMVFEGKFNVTSKIKWIMPLAGVVAVLYGILLLVTMFGVRGFVVDVPRVDRVSGVHISFDGFMEDDMDFSRDSDTINNAVALHRQIADTIDFRTDLTRSQRDDMRSSDIRDHNRDRRDVRNDMRDAFWESITGGGEQFTANGGRHLYLTYLLTDGSRVYRRYALSGAFLLEIG
ncbi:MAG: hypothetical protein FWC13_00005 [Oscillospiraceae bacterium]|nr:hypothetical protein [Oscillospiraceae bacterium]MCL2247634.1 hypothetical protein [Oscillospiraceae bacterium]